MLKSTTTAPLTPIPPSVEDLISQAAASPRKVFLMALELRLSLGMPPPNDDSAIMRFLKSLDRKLGRRLYLDPQHAWRRVRNGTRPMYHYVLLLNGDSLGSVYGARVIVQEAWNLALGLPREPNYGLVGHGRLGDDGCVMLWRDAPFLEDTLKDCRAWASLVSC